MRGLQKRGRDGVSCRERQRQRSRPSKEGARLAGRRRFVQVLSEFCTSERVEWSIPPLRGCCSRVSAVGRFVRCDAAAAARVCVRRPCGREAVLFASGLRYMQAFFFCLFFLLDSCQKSLNSLAPFVVRFGEKRPWVSCRSCCLLRGGGGACRTLQDYVAHPGVCIHV